MPYKQVILVREDLKLPKGKLAAQCSHASVDTILKSDKKLTRKNYNKKIFKVISIRRNNMNETTDIPQIPLEDRAYVLFFRKGGNSTAKLPKGYDRVDDGLKGTKAYIGFTGE